MPYVPPKYPGAIPTIGDLPDRADDVDWLYAARYNELKKELRAALIELGTLPKGASADVKTRLGLLAPKASPTFAGVAIIPTINLPGGQIKFPATAAPSADANTLDDYEEGYYTATLTCGTSGTITINTDYDQLAYTKIGRSVHVQGNIIITSVSSPVGALTLNLPMTATDLTEGADQASGNIAYYTLNALGAAGSLAIVVNAAAATASIIEQTTTVWVAAADHIKASSSLYISVVYAVE